MSIGVTLVTGFLGSGKTTLINQVLKDPKLDKESVVVIENEVGDINIDHRLILETTEQIYDLNQGCICCNLRQDLLYVFDRIAKLYQEGGWNLEHIIIETTGIADPRPIIQTVQMMAGSDKLFKVDSVYSLVDCENYAYYLETYDEASAQIVFADKVFLSKVEDQDLGKVKQDIASLNPFAEFAVVDLTGPMPAADFLGQGLFNKSDHISLLAEWEGLDDDHHHDCGHDHHDHDEGCSRHDHDHHHHHDHDHRIDTIYLETEVPLASNYLQMYLDWLLMTQMDSLYRYKGFIKLDHTEKTLVLQGVGMSYDLDYTDQVQSQKTELVLIGRDLQATAIKQSFDDLISYSHQVKKA